MHVTRIQLCGRLVVEIGGGQVQDALPGRQGRALFGYLAANRHRAHSRESLMEVLWPSRAPASADSALSALLSGIRRALGEGVLAGRSELRLCLEAGAWIDLEAAEEAIHRAESAIFRAAWTSAWGPSLAALAVSRRPFLPEVDAAWADEWRRRLEDIRLSALACYSACALGIGGGELPVGQRAAQELVAGAPFREQGRLLLMRTLAARGNAAEALRAYEEFRCLLRDDLGASPGPELRDFQARLLRGTASDGHVTSAGGRAD